MKPTLLSLLRGGKHSIRDMAKILGISRSKVSWFIAELERRKWGRGNQERNIFPRWNPFQQAERIQG
ncbi:winged helix-turn-helix transcriptional regulator [Escherichia coli]|uniref:winged helix-turn-helix transcriptional regulator n=1 Tax=Escherichia coli TaxID=562 RepID=UPI003D2F5F6D